MSVVGSSVAAMLVDDRLRPAVDAFVTELGPVLRAAVRRTTGGDPSRASADVTLEAYNLCRAFIDADGHGTDAEIWALLGAFSAEIAIPLAGASPDDVRKAGLVAGARSFLWQPSVMFEILLGLDLRDGTDHARRYVEMAVLLGHSVAAIDLPTSRSELLAIEDFRDLLGQVIEVAGQPTPGPGASGGAVPASDAPVSDDAVTDDAATAGAATEMVDTLVEELPPPRPLPELLTELEGLVGLAGVKEEVKLVSALIQVQNLRRERGLAVLDQSRHLIFTGNPGTGKTTVARLLAQIYRTLGVVDRGQLVETDRSGLVAGYIGQTATKVTEVFDQADEGVLLIDEAYALVRGGERDFGLEAIDTIVKLVEDRRDRVVVIAAGYTDEMRHFVEANPGLTSRFPKTIFFPDYSTDELIEIFKGQCEKGHYTPDADALTKVRSVIDAIPREKGFGNGRAVRNLFEAAVAQQAIRIVAIEDPTDVELVTLTPADIADHPQEGVSTPDTTDTTDEAGRR